MTSVFWSAEHFSCRISCILESFHINWVKLTVVGMWLHRWQYLTSYSALPHSRRQTCQQVIYHDGNFDDLFRMIPATLLFCRGSFSLLNYYTICEQIFSGLLNLSTSHPMVLSSIDELCLNQSIQKCSQDGNFSKPIILSTYIASPLFSPASLFE